MKVVIMGCGRVGARVSAVLDHNGHPVAAVALTFPHGTAPEPAAVAVQATALALSRRLGG